jgi:hypothetical protein
MSQPRHARRGDVHRAVPMPTRAATPPAPDDERVSGGRRPLHAVPDPAPSPEPEPEPATPEEYARIVCQLTPFELSTYVPGIPTSKWGTTSLMSTSMSGVGGPRRSTANRRSSSERAHGHPGRGRRQRPHHSAPNNRSGSRCIPRAPAGTPGALSASEPAAADRPPPAASRRLHAVRHRAGRRLRPGRQQRHRQRAQLDLRPASST